MKKIKLKIIGMHCISCAMNIDGDLEDCVKGVRKAQTNYPRGECQVEFDEEVVPIQAIKQKLNRKHFF